MTLFCKTFLRKLFGTDCASRLFVVRVGYNSVYAHFNIRHRYNERKQNRITRRIIFQYTFIHKQVKYFFHVII